MEWPAALCKVATLAELLLTGNCISKFPLLDQVTARHHHFRCLFSLLLLSFISSLLPLCLLLLLLLLLLLMRDCVPRWDS